MGEKTYEYAVAQLAKLDNKLGPGVGAMRERAKLQKVIDETEGALAAQSSTSRTRRGKRGAKK